MQDKTSKLQKVSYANIKNSMKKNQESAILNEWDLLAERFDTYKIKSEVHPDAAVNVYVGWPIFAQQIDFQSDVLGKKQLNILDYGCGAGEFCKFLDQLGHHVVGVDKSEKMLELASEKVNGKVKISHISDLFNKIESGEYENKFDVITSIHVFDWIKDIDELLTELSNVLNKQGIIIFAIFPVSHIKDSLQIKDLFEDFDSIDCPKEGIANFDGVKIPTYVKEPSYYDEYFNNHNFEKVLEYYPQYPKAFLTKYNWTASLKPEMVVLAYRKL